MSVEYSRHINFEEVLNFRDLGGYRTHDGRQVAWRRIFRSGEMLRMTSNDMTCLKEEIKLNSVIDLRNPRGQEQQEEIELLDKVGAKYYNVPFRDSSLEKEIKLYKDFSSMGEVYLYRIKQKEFSKRLLKALEIIAVVDNYPLVFHCSVGKDRSGILAAVILGTLDITDEDIITDYILSAKSMKAIMNRVFSDPEVPEYVKTLPGYTWEAVPESMVIFLAGIRQEYGSIREYVQKQGADSSSFSRLENALLV